VERRPSPRCQRMAAERGLRYPWLESHLSLILFADLQSDSVEDKTWREQLQRPETIELIQLYYAISNP
jgi:hypothetical protein